VLESIAAALHDPPPRRPPTKSGVGRPTGEG
jgi:hypothetical protein